MKVALVTGASRGLGAEIAKQLGMSGWHVAINCAKDTEGAGRVAASIHESGGDAIVEQFDVTDQAAVSSGIAKISQRLGSVDLIVNNATGPQPVLALELQRWEHYLDQLTYSVRAPLQLLQEVLPDWRRRHSGRIINIGSEVVSIGSASFGHYVTAKAAMVGLTRSWANELGKDGITVNLVAPGWIPVERHSTVKKDDLESYRMSVPLAKMGVPKDVAGLVVFLASPAADFITGQSFYVNGGRTFL
jgi:3-oxoacyl-[acyl-carrier protein] reductase